MNAKFLFEQFPEAESCWIAGSDAFLNESEAEAYAKHFNMKHKEVTREEITGEIESDVEILDSPIKLDDTNFGKAVASQVSKKDQAKADAQAKLDAKAQADAQAELDAKAQADAQAEIDAKAQADAQAEIDAKAQADAAPPAIVDVP